MIELRAEIGWNWVKYGLGWFGMVSGFDELIIAEEPDGLTFPFTVKTNNNLFSNLFINRKSKENLY